MQKKHYQALNKDNKHSDNEDNRDGDNRHEDKNDDEGIIELFHIILENLRSNRNVSKRLKNRTSDNNISLHSFIRMWI